LVKRFFFISRTRGQFLVFCGERGKAAFFFICLSSFLSSSRAPRFERRAEEKRAGKQQRFFHLLFKNERESLGGLCKIPKTIQKNVFLFLSGESLFVFSLFVSASRLVTHGGEWKKRGKGKRRKEVRRRKRRKRARACSLPPPPPPPSPPPS